MEGHARNRPYVVLDTNVFVAAGFNPRSRAARIVEAIEAGRIRLAWNRPTWRETKHVISKIPPLDWERFAALFRDEEAVEAITVPEAFQIIPDAEDRKFAALSDVTGAPLISNDRHLLDHRGELRIAVLTPGEFWDALQESSVSEDLSASRHRLE